MIINDKNNPWKIVILEGGSDPALDVSASSEPQPHDPATVSMVTRGLVNDLVKEAVAAQQNHVSVDMSFVCGDGQKIKVHRSIMCCGSNLLASLLADMGREEEETSCVIFPGVNGQDLISVVSAVYTGLCQVLYVQFF